jgi:hypothetical protein
MYRSMRLNPMARIFAFVLSLVILILLIESVPHSVHHMGEPEGGKAEKPCPFLSYWLQGSSSKVPDSQINILTNNHLIEYLPLSENPLIEFYIDSSLLIRSPPILG